MILLLQILLTLAVFHCNADDDPEATIHKRYECYNDDDEKQVKVRKEVLYGHNMARDLHNSPSVKWDNSIARAAQRYAEELADNAAELGADLPHSEPSERNHRGENLAYWSVKVNAEEVVVGPTMSMVNWYNEIMNYDFSTHTKISNFMPIGHFTQMVWKETKKVGCGLATVELPNNRHNTYLVCQYEPAGNRPGHYADNVPETVDAISMVTPPELDKNGCCDYMGECHKYRKMCKKYPILKMLCGVTCESCTEE